MKLFISVVFIISAITGCSSIEHTTEAEQKLDKPLFAGIGDTVLRIKKERNMENAFGKSDIFGRKTNEGYTEIKFAGVEQNGEVVLYRNDIGIITNETTMSRTPISTTAGTAKTNATAEYYGDSGYVTGNANATTNTSSVTLKPLSDYHAVIPSDAITIRLKPGERKIPIGGYLIEIFSASQNMIEYKVSSNK